MWCSAAATADSNTCGAAQSEGVGRDAISGLAVAASRSEVLQCHHLRERHVRFFIWTPASSFASPTIKHSLGSTARPTR